MSKIIDESLQKIAKGSTAVLLGTILSLVLGFLSRIILVRFTTQNEYGIYSLALTIVTICTMISALGLQDGTTRYIAYFRGKNETKNVQDIIISSIITSLVASILVTGLVFTIADYIATEIFNSPDISYILRIMSVSIPFSVLINIIVSVFRGFDRVTTRVYFNNILQPSIYLFILGAAVYFNCSFAEVVVAYLVAILITFLVIFVYFFKEMPLLFSWKQIHINHNTKILLQKSIPLLGVNILLLTMAWTDTLMLGYFKTTEIVASYNAVYPIAALVSTGINSIGYLYVPIISNLYSKNQIEELGRINENATKWNFVVTLPIFSIIFLFPEFVLNMLYGSRYIEASNVLQVLALGFIINSFFGFNYYTLISAGKSRLLMNCSLISSILNVILNLILIIPFGMFGAAIASAVSYTLIEVYMTLKLYQTLRIHPFTKTYLKFTIVSILLLGIFYIFKTLFVQNFWTITGFYSIYLLTYAISVPLTNSLDEEDIKILVQLERRFGVDFLSSRLQKYHKEFR